MDTDLVPAVDDHLRLLRERLDRMARDEPGGADAVVVRRGRAASASRPRRRTCHARCRPASSRRRTSRASPATASTSTPYAHKISLAICRSSSLRLRTGAYREPGARTVLQPIWCAACAAPCSVTTGPRREAAGGPASSASGFSTPCSAISGSSSTTGAAACTCCETARGGRRSCPTSARCGRRRSGSTASPSTRSTQALLAALEACPESWVGGG